MTLSWTLRTTTTSVAVTGTSTVPAGYKTVVLRATVTTSGGTPNGTVTFKRSTGTAMCTTVALTGGHATCRFRNTTHLGTHSYYASYTGNAAYAKSTSGDLSVKTVKDLTTMTKVSVTPAKGLLTVKVSPPSYADTTLGGGGGHLLRQAPRVGHSAGQVLHTDHHQRPGRRRRRSQ